MKMQEKGTDKRFVWHLFLALALAIVFMRLLDSSLIPAFNAALRACIPFIFAFVAAYLLRAPVQWVQAWLTRWFSKNKPHRWQRVTATTLVMAVTIGLCLLLVASLLPAVVDNGKELAKNLPAYVPKAKEMLTKVLANLSDVVGKDLQQAIADGFTKLTDDLLKNTSDYLGFAYAFVVALGKLTFGLIIGIISAFYLLLDFDRYINLGKRVLRSMVTHDSLYYNYTDFIKETDRVMTKFISGKLLTSLIVGVLCFIGFLFIGIKGNILFSTIIAITNLIPYIGPFIGAVLPLLLALMDDPVKALEVVVLIVIVQQLDNNVIGPKIIGDMLKINPFWILVGVILGGAMFGLAGTLLGAPVIALIASVMRKYMELRRIQRNARKEQQKQESCNKSE